MISKIKELIDYSNTHSVILTKEKEIELLKYIKNNYDFLYYKTKGKKKLDIIKKYSTKYMVEIDIPYFIFNFGCNRYLKFNFFKLLKNYSIKWSFNKNDLESMPKMFKKGDYVYVIFYDGHKEKGQIIDILDTDFYNYVVNIKVFDKDAEIYCNEKDLVKYD